MGLWTSTWMTCPMSFTPALFCIISVRSVRRLWMNNLCWEHHKVTTPCSLLHNAITIQQSESNGTSSKTQNHATTISLTVTRWRVGECLQSTLTLKKVFSLYGFSFCALFKNWLELCPLKINKWLQQLLVLFYWMCKCNIRITVLRTNKWYLKNQVSKHNTERN